jgi:RNA polymerase sigma factor (sigma-70 family)
MVLRVCRDVLHDWHAAEDAFQATFLVLASKAASIRKGTSVGGWLRGVAQRLALKARARRRSSVVDTAQAPGTADEPLADISLREAHAVLHEELQRLPMIYREPLCLCYLEGKTRDEAARQLGWPAGTFNTRMNRARQLLHRRLVGRGLALSSVLFTTLLSGSAAKAAVPAALADLTLKAALRFAAGKTVTGAAVTLAEGMLHTMNTIKLKLLAALVLVGGLFTAGTGIWLHQPALAEQPASATKQEPSPAPAPMPKADRFGDPLPQNALARMGTLRGRHTGIAYVACLPDGKSVVTASHNGTLRLWDTETAKEIRSFQMPVENDDPLKKMLKDEPQVKMMMNLMADRGPSGKLVAAALSPDGKILAAAPYQGTVRLWDVATGKELPPIKSDKESTISGLTFAPDIRALAVARGTGLIHVYDLDTGKEIVSVGQKRDKFKINGLEVDVGVSSMAFAADGKTMLVADFVIDNKVPRQVVKVWDVKTGKEVRQLKRPDSAFGNIAVAPDAKTIAWRDFTAGAVVLWDVDNDKELRQLKCGQDLTLAALTFAPDGKVLAIKSSRGPIQLWDVVADKQIAELGEDRRGNPGKGFQFIVSDNLGNGQVAFSADGKTVVSGSNNTVRVWDVAIGKERARHDAHRGPLMSLAVSPDGKVLTSRGEDDTVRQWDMGTGKLLRQLQLKPGAGASAFSADGRTVAFTMPDDHVLLWDIETDKERRALDSEVSAGDLAFSADGTMLATMTRGHEIRLWDAASGKELRRMQNEKADGQDGPDFVMPFGRKGTTGLLFSPDGQMLASIENKGSIRLMIGGGNGFGAADDLSIRLWNVATGKLIRKFDSSTDGVTAVAFTPDGRMLATANRNQTLTLWETATGKLRAEFKSKDPSTTTVLAVAFSPDGKTLAAGGADGSIQIWDVAIAAALGRLTGHQGPAAALAFAPDGRLLASGSDDTTALVWNLAGMAAKRQQADLQDGELQSLWADLQSDDAAKAWQAIQRLSTAPASPVWLGKHLRPVAPADPQRLKELVAGLNSDRFQERNAAADQLEKLDDLAVPALQKLLEGQPPLEVRQRVERVLDNILTKQVLSGEQLQALRALEALEWAGTPESRQVLQVMAKGAPAARLTRAALAALDRCKESHK